MKSSDAREIRVFLSSTFNDMNLERSYLVKHVFPRVRDICLARHVGFTEIDLRWGVTEDDSRNGRTLDICLKEIDRCRDFPPFFIGFIGERYGWVPSKEKLNIKQSQFESDSLYNKSILSAIQRGISITELEMELAALNTSTAGNLKGNVLFLLRDRTLTETLYKNEKNINPSLNYTSYYDACGDKLQKFKERLRDSPFLGIDGYTSIEQFGQAVEEHLINQINRNFPDETTPDKHQLRNSSHIAFRKQVLQNFLPRHDLRQVIVSTLEHRQTYPDQKSILITGSSGQGKSTFMAELAMHLKSLQKYRVIDYYIGADGEMSLSSWVNYVLQTIEPFVAGHVSSIPSNPEEQLRVLPKWLSLAANREQCQFILMLDGLDHLNDQGRDIRILRNSYYGAEVMVIASAEDNSMAIMSGSSLGFELYQVPALNDLQCKKVVIDTLAQYCKEMPTELINKISASPKTSSPLFLKLALTKLRLDAKHESLYSDTDRILAHQDASMLFLSEFIHDQDYERPEQPALALEFMALIAASRNGLSEHELSELLAIPTDPISEETGKPRLPQIYLSQLISVFQPFIISKKGNHAPMHSLLGQKALSDYGVEHALKKIANYFELERIAQRNLDRVAIELPFILLDLKQNDMVKRVITDPRVAISILKRNHHEFTKLWTMTIRNIGGTSNQAEKLYFRINDTTERCNFDIEDKSKLIISYAKSLTNAGEIDFASRLFHGVATLYKGKISLETLKEAFIGFIKCFTYKMINFDSSEISLQKYKELEKTGEKCIDFMVDLLRISQNDSWIDKAENQLLRSILGEKLYYLTLESEAENIRLQGIIDALIILEDEKIEPGITLYSTKAKAQAMMLKAQLDSISRNWNHPEIRDKFLNQALVFSIDCEEFTKNNLPYGDIQRIFLQEHLSELYFKMACSAPDMESKRFFFTKSLNCALNILDELKQSNFNGEQHDYRFLNATETIAYALESGLIDEFPENTLYQLINATSPETLADTTSSEILAFAKEVNSRLLNLYISA